MNKFPAIILMMLAGIVHAKPVVQTHIFKVAQVLKEKDSKESSQVLLKAGRNEGILANDSMHVYRQVKGLWIDLATLTAVEVQDDVSVFAVANNEEGINLARKMMPKYIGVMAGDLVMKQDQVVEPRKVMSPVTTVQYNQLFVDADNTPTTFELSDSGLLKLEEVVQGYAPSRIESLMVEGYTDHNGRADVNQVESYQRARAVRQILIDKFGFDADRVIAVGFGESEQVDRTFSPGYIERNRRIVFKVVPVIEE